MYHYTDSGLENIYLVNGFIITKTAYGEAVAIDDLGGLHKAIGRWLVNEPNPITGAKLRFLRHELDLSQKALGSMMGKSEQAVRRWEKVTSKVIDPIADRLVRIIYTAQVDGNVEINKLIDKLALADQAEATECRLEETNGRWRIAA
jgi:putative transcriptional regulator